MKFQAVQIVLFLAVLLLIFFGVHAAIMRTDVEGSSMEPNLQDKQLIMLVKAAYWFSDPQRGDIVVFHDTSRPLGHQDIVHRIVGLPKETVEIRNGQVYINNKKLEEPYIQGDLISRAPEIVPDDSYLIVGDNRYAAASDIVSRNEIRGRVCFVFWPVSNWHLLRGYSYSAD